MAELQVIKRRRFKPPLPAIKPLSQWGLVGVLWGGILVTFLVGVAVIALGWRFHFLGDTGFLIIFGAMFVVPLFIPIGWNLARLARAARTVRIETADASGEAWAARALERKRRA